MSRAKGEFISKQSDRSGSATLRIRHRRTSDNTERGCTTREFRFRAEETCPIPGTMPGNRVGEYDLDANDSVAMTVELENGAMGVIHASRWATSYLRKLREVGPVDLVPCLFGVLRSSAFELSMCPELWRLPQGLASLRDRRFALPAWDRENEVAQSQSRPDRTMRSAQGTKRTHLIHHPAKDVFPPVGGTLFPYFAALPVRRRPVRLLASSGIRCHSATCDALSPPGDPASATIALRKPRRLATFIAQAFSHEHFVTHVSNTWAAS